MWARRRFATSLSSATETGASVVGIVGHERLVTGLGVGDLGGRQPATGAEGQAEMPGDLAGAEQPDPGLGGAEGR